MASSIHIGRGSANLGTFSEAEVREGLQSGRFFLTDLGWREGLESWKPLAQFPEFSANPMTTEIGVPPLSRGFTPTDASSFASEEISATTQLQSTRFMTKRITRLAPLQFGVVLAALYGSLSLIFVPFILLFAFLGSRANGNHSGVLAGGFFLIFLPILYAAMGFILGVIMAAIYNLIALWTGGIELTLDDAPPR